MEKTTYLEITKKPIEERTDKELELTRIILQRESNRHLNAISKNLQFFFWLTIISLALAILAYILSEM